MYTHYKIIIKNVLVCVYLKIAFGGEGLLADGASKGLVTSMRSHMDL